MIQAILKNDDDTNNKSNENNDIDDGSIVNTMVSFNSSEVEDTTNNKNKKRVRSLDSDSSNSDGEINIRAKKVKNVRRLVIEDEDDD